MFRFDLGPFLQGTKYYSSRASKNFRLAEFQQPSSILMEMKNVIKHPARDACLYSGHRGARDIGSTGLRIFYCL